MKRFILWSLAVLAVTFISCEDDELSSNAGWFDETRVEHVSGTSAYVVCTTSFAESVLNGAEAGFYYTAEDSDQMQKTDRCEVSGQTFSAYLKGLTPNTMYRVFPYVVLGGRQLNGLDFTVETSSDEVADPVVKITSSTEFKAKSMGDTFTVEYMVENPVEGVKIEAVAEENWITDFKYEDQKITFTVLENKGAQRHAKVALNYSWYEAPEFEVEQEGAPFDIPASDDPIYRNNFDKVPAVKGATGWPYLDETDAWKNHEGRGAAGVEYEFESMSVRTTKEQSAGYADASGVNKLFFGKMPATMTIKGIATSGKQKFRLTFGASYDNLQSGVHEFPMDKFVLTLGNGAGWSAPVEFHKIGGDDDVAPYWVRYAADFTIPNNVSRLSIRFEAKEAVVFAIDDVILDEGEGGKTISFDGQAPDPDQPTGTQIADVIAGGANQAVEVEGQIVAKHERGFLIQDATGILYVYEPTDAKVGDFVKVAGTTTEYGKLIQLGSGTSVTKTKDGQFTQPKAAVWTGAEVDAYVKGDAPLAITYVKVSGELSMTENSKYPGQYYYNVKIAGATATGSIVNPLEGMVNPAWSGKKITITGYTIGCSGKEGQYFNMMASKVEEGEGSTDPDPQPETGAQIADIIAGGANQAVEVEGQIVAKHERGFLIQDATGSLYVYEPTDAQVGDFVKVAGTTAEYGKLIQLGKGATATKTKSGEFTQPLPEEWNPALISEYCAGVAPLAITYIKYRGELSMTENSKYPGQYYYNVAIAGANVTGSIVNPLEGMVDPAWSGKMITITGYTIGVSGRDSQYFNVMATEVVLGDGSQVDPQPENTPKFGTPHFENVTETTVEISCAFEFGVDGVEPYFLIRKTDGTGEHEVKANREGNVMKGYVGGLIPGTAYEFDLNCTWNGKTYTSGVAKFTTKAKEGEGGSSVESNTKYKGWAELPNEDLSKKNKEYYYAYHICPDIYTATGNARNFTTCYSKSKICPVWVAAPLHVSYAGGGRHDAYKPDPDIKCEQNGKWSGYTRGHMLGSAERNRTVATNHQVFYFSNIAPQLGQNGYFNTGGGQWNTTEDWVDKQWRNSNDTCYQVVGCYWENTSKDVNGTKIPTHFYTVLLKAKKGVKKWVGDCTADELQTICIWVRHKNYSKSEVVKPNNFEAKGMFKTVEEIEKLTGHKFFTNVPNVPKKSYNTRDWNF